jgi:raffinose/stachyose/melibiose transport system substrate-binding protein
MMMTFKPTHRPARWIALLAVGLAGVLSLAACGGSSGNSPDASATSGNITWWGWSPDSGTADAYIQAFNKVYPHIHVTYKLLTIAGWNAALRPALASPDGPDVFDIAPGPGVTEFGPDALDLTSAVTKALGPDWRSKVAAIGVGPLMQGKKLTSLSVGSTFAGTLWINQQLFDQYHLTPPKTLAEWVHVCAVFKAHGQGCFVQGAGQVAFNQDTLQSIADSIQPGWWTKASRGQAKWTSPVFVRTLTIWRQLFTDGIMEPGALGVQQYPDANNDFLSGKDAMVMMGTWFMEDATVPVATAAISAAGVAHPKPFTMIAIPFPDVAGEGHPASLYGDAGDGLAVNSRSSQAAAATTFVTWLTTSQAGQQSIANAINQIAARNGITPQWSKVQLVAPSVQRPNIEGLIKEAATVAEPRLSLISANLAQAIGVASTTVASGQATPQQAAQTLQSASGQ